MNAIALSTALHRQPVRRTGHATHDTAPRAARRDTFCIKSLFIKYCICICIQMVIYHNVMILERFSVGDTHCEQ
jgi:hypothetical protein